MATWSCSICARTMQEQNKKPHLDGKPHAVQVQRGRKATESADYNQIRTGNEAKKRLPRRNTNNKAKVDTTVPACYVASQVRGSPTASKINPCPAQNTDDLLQYTATSHVANSLLWTCTLCNMSMAPALGPAHLVCEEHIERLVCSIRVPNLMAPQEQYIEDSEGRMCEPPKM